MDAAYLSSVCPIEDYISNHRFIVATNLGARTVAIRFRVKDIGEGCVTSEMLKSVIEGENDRLAARTLLIAKVRVMLETLKLAYQACESIVFLVANNGDRQEILFHVTVLRDSLETIGVNDEFDQPWAKFFAELHKQLNPGV